VEAIVSDNWNSYQLLVNNEPASNFVDLGIGRSAPLRRYDQLAYIRLRMLQPRADGLSSQEEFDELKRIEDALAEAVEKQSETVYVGSNTSGGNRDFYFYTTNTDIFEAVAAKATAAFECYEFMLGSRPDRDWQVYFDFLYPSPVQMHQIKNREVLQHLRNNGDRLAEAREIDHFAYFSELAARKAFVAYIGKCGFSIKATPTPSDSADYSLKFSRMDAPIDIDDVTTELAKAVSAHRGQYDGWGCPIVA